MRMILLRMQSEICTQNDLSQLLFTRKFSGYYNMPQNNNTATVICRVGQKASHMTFSLNSNKSVALYQYFLRSVLVFYQIS